MTTNRWIEEPYLSMANDTLIDGIVAEALAGIEADMRAYLTSISRGELQSIAQGRVMTHKVEWLGLPGDKPTKYHRQIKEISNAPERQRKSTAKKLANRDGLKEAALWAAYQRDKKKIRVR